MRFMAVASPGEKQTARFPPDSAGFLLQHTDLSHIKRVAATRRHTGTMLKSDGTCVYVTDSVLTPDRRSVRTKSSDCSDSTLPV